MSQVTIYPTTPMSRLADAEARFSKIERQRYLYSIDASIFLLGLKEAPFAILRQFAGDCNLPVTKGTKRDELIEMLYQMKRENYNLPDLEERAEALYKSMLDLHNQLPK